jgi:hypothetical protein
MAKGIKTGGRELGTPNKTTAETRLIIKSILDRELEKLPQYIDSITKPEIKARIIIDLLPYIVTKVQNEPIEVNSEGIIVRVIREKEHDTNKSLITLSNGTEIEL